MLAILKTQQAEEAQRLKQEMQSVGLFARLVSHVSGLAGVDTVLIPSSEVPTVQSRFPSARIISFAGRDTAGDAVASMQAGAHDYIPMGASVDALIGVLDTHEAAQSELDEAAEIPHPSAEYVAVSPNMRELFALAQRVAVSDISVLISGESGTGKEVLAQYIHRTSHRVDGPMVAINCAAIPESMLEAELFGYEKGAFTGASERRLGKFEVAHSGTLLLDEVTEMPLALQAKLLRVLQERQVERLGSHTPRGVDVRVIATTNRPVHTLVKERVLREDLYYRLSVFPLRMPALRSRNLDLLPLTQHFITKHGGGRDYTMTEDAEEVLLNHTWPGNVRELENSVQRAMVLSDDALLRSHHFGLELNTNDTEALSLAQRVRDREEDILLDTLKQNNGARKVTARELGISERTLRYKLKQLRDRGIDI